MDEGNKASNFLEEFSGGDVFICVNGVMLLKKKGRGQSGNIEFIFSNDNDTEHIGAVIMPCVVLFR